MQYEPASSRIRRSPEHVPNIDIIFPQCYLFFSSVIAFFPSVIPTVSPPDADKHPSAALSTDSHGSAALEGSPAPESFRLSQRLPLGDGRVQRMRPGRTGHRQRCPGSGFHFLLRSCLFSVSIAPKTQLSPSLGITPLSQKSNFKGKLPELLNPPSKSNLGLEN